MNKKTVSKVNLFLADLFREWKKTKIFNDITINLKSGTKISLQKYCIRTI